MSCNHRAAVKTGAPRTQGCEQCLKIGDRWVELRLCRTCGHVGCCDSSKNKHATRHFRASQHPIITTLQPGQTWSWCYIDQVTFQL